MKKIILDTFNKILGRGSGHKKRRLNSFIKTTTIEPKKWGNFYVDKIVGRNQYSNNYEQNNVGQKSIGHKINKSQHNSKYHQNNPEVDAVPVHFKNLLLILLVPLILVLSPIILILCFLANYKLLGATLLGISLGVLVGFALHTDCFNQFLPIALQVQGGWSGDVARFKMAGIAAYLGMLMYILYMLVSSRAK